MQAIEFCYWLKGYFELRREEVGISNQQIQIIEDHLKLVFNKVTPTYDPCKPYTIPYCGGGQIYHNDLLKYDCQVSC